MNRTARESWCLVFLAACGLTAFGCAGVQVSSGPSTISYPPLTLESLRSATYPCEQAASGRVTLSGGSYIEPASPGRPDPIKVSLADQWTTFGDLDTDTNKDAVVILVTRPRGSEVLYNLVAVVNPSGAAEARASILLGDRVRLNAVKILAGKIVVDLYRQGPHDLVTNPKQRFKETYEFSGSFLTRVDQTPVATIGPVH